MMNNFNIDFWFLLISNILLFLLTIYLFRHKNKTQLKSIFIIDLILTLIITAGVLFQALCTNLFSMDPIIFENITYYTHLI